MVAPRAAVREGNVSAHRWRLALVCLVFFAFWMRIYRLDAQNLRGDEAFSYLFSSYPLGKILTLSREREPHPPLYYPLLHFWMPATGQSEFALRYPSLFFSLLGVPLAFALGRELFQLRVGLLTALAVAINPFHLFYAQEVRMYAMAASLGLASSVTFLRALRYGGKTPWAIYAVASVLALYAHYGGLLVLLAQGIFFLLFWPLHRARWPAWALSQLVIGLAFLPWVVSLTFGLYGGYGGTGVTLGLWDYLKRLFLAFNLGEATNWQRLLPWVSILGLVALVGLGSSVVRQTREAVFLILFLTVPLAGFFWLSQNKPIFHPRYMLMASFPYYALVALGLTTLASWLGRWRLGAATVLLAGLGLMGLVDFQAIADYHFNPIYAKSGNWRERARFIEEYERPGDLIVENVPDPVFSYYYHGSSPRQLVPARQDMSPGEVAETLNQLLLRHGRVWFIHGGGTNWDPEMVAQKGLDIRALRLDNRAFPNPNLLLYLSPVVLATTSDFFTVQRANFGGQVELQGYIWGRDELLQGGRGQISLHAGETLHLGLLWRSLGKTEASYTVFVHLVDGQRQLWAQSDSLPAQGMAPTTGWREGEIILDRHSMALRPDMPAGSYRLETGLYRLDTMERLPIISSDGKTLDNSVVLAEVNVVIK